MILGLRIWELSWSRAMTSVSISVVDLILGVLNVSRVSFNDAKVYPHVSLNSSVLPQTILMLLEVRGGRRPW